MLRDELQELALAINPRLWEGKDPETLTPVEEAAACAWIREHGGYVAGMFGSDTVASAYTGRLVVRQYIGIDVTEV